MQGLQLESSLGKEVCIADPAQEYVPPKPQIERTESYKSSHARSNQSHQCCAFRKLDENLKNAVENENDDSIENLFIWAVMCRDKDPELDDYIKRSCPLVKNALAKCTFSLDSGNGNFMEHMSKCPFRKYGTYECPYCKKIETFTIPRKLWCRAGSLRDIFHKYCELGSKLGPKGIHRALSNKRQRYHIPYDNSIDNESTTSEKSLLTNSRSLALQSGISSQARGFESGYCKLLDVETSAMQEDVPQSSAISENSDAITYIPTPLSSSYTSSSERFGTPPSPQDVKPLVDHVEAEESSSSGKQASLGNMRFEWPMNQSQPLQITSTLSIRRAANKRPQAKGMPILRVNTDCARSRSVTPLKPDSPTSPSEQLLSSPDNPQVLRYEPIRIFHQLRNTFQNSYLITYAQLSISPRPRVNQEIIDSHIIPASVFFSGWTAVEIVLNGHIPQDFWSLFSLAQLAFACGQVIWETELEHQFDEIVNELTVWSYALFDPSERHRYQEVIKQIFVKKDRNSTDAHEASYRTTSSPTQSSTSSIHHRDVLPLDHNELLAILQDGVVIRLCLQFLCTYEFLQYRAERNKRLPNSASASSTQNAYLHNDNANFLDSAVIQPLLSSNQFHALESVIEKGANLLREYPNTTSRELEVFLVCRARYYTQDHNLHLKFRKAITNACSQAGLHYSKPFLLNDIAAIRQCQKDLAPIQGINQNELQVSYANIGAIAELDGSPIEAPPSGFTYTTQKRSSCLYPRSGPGRRHYHSPIQTPTSAYITSPSTAASTQAPSLLMTPISGYSTSPATASELNFPSMDWQSTGIITEQMSFNLELEINNSDYSLFTNDVVSTDTMFPDINFNDADVNDMTTSEIIPQDLSLFTTPIPTTSERPAGPSAKASRSCQICNKVFTSKEQHLPSNLQRHMREQHGTKPGITCEICHKIFKRKHNLKVHMNTVHSQDRNSVQFQDRSLIQSQDRNLLQSPDRTSVYSQGW